MYLLTSKKTTEERKECTRLPERQWGEQRAESGAMVFSLSKDSDLTAFPHVAKGPLSSLAGAKVLGVVPISLMSSLGHIELS